MFLHKDDRELFHDVIITVSDRMGIAIDIIEKDYYVTMILSELAKRSDNVVFKGGTSLSKVLISRCHAVASKRVSSAFLASSAIR